MPSQISTHSHNQCTIIINDKKLITMCQYNMFFSVLDNLSAQKQHAPTHLPAISTYANMFVPFPNIWFVAITHTQIYASPDVGICVIACICRTCMQFKRVTSVCACLCVCVCVTNPVSKGREFTVVLSITSLQGAPGAWAGANEDTSPMLVILGRRHVPIDLKLWTVDKLISALFPSTIVMARWPINHPAPSNASELPRKNFNLTSSMRLLHFPSVGVCVCACVSDGQLPASLTLNVSCRQPRSQIHQNVHAWIVHTDLGMAAQIWITRMFMHSRIGLPNATLVW